MASVLANVAQAAHSAAAAMLSAAQIEAGEPIPQKPVKEEDPERSITLDLSGMNIIVCGFMSILCQVLMLSQ
jgi:2-Cys peroxiredoxin 5